MTPIEATPLRRAWPDRGPAEDPDFDRWMADMLVPIFVRPLPPQPPVRVREAAHPWAVRETLLIGATCTAAVLCLLASLLLAAELALLVARGLGWRP